jgi:hypothetical protein
LASFKTFASKKEVYLSFDQERREPYYIKVIKINLVLRTLAWSSCMVLATGKFLKNCKEERAWLSQFSNIFPLFLELWHETVLALVPGKFKTVASKKEVYPGGDHKG